jgi:hypothetical protein
MPRASGGVRRAALLAAVLVFGASAWAASALACTNLATITLSSSSGHVGDTITLIGTSFPVPRSPAPNSSTPGVPPTPVVIHWKSSDGPVLATVTPDRTGTISATFTVPPTEPGNVVIVALQRRPLADPAAPDGPPKAYIDEVGTPARATFRILAPGEVVTTIPSSRFVSAGGDHGSTGLIVLMVLFGTVALSLFAGGVIAFLHQIRSQRRDVVPLQWPPW